MALCPKCNFEGSNEEQCERCGIIFDKMHTILEMRPIDAIPARAKAASVNVDPQDAPTQMESPRVLISDAAPSAGAVSAFDRDATNLDVPLVARVPVQTTSSFAGPMLVLLFVIVVVWGALQYRQSRVRVAREATVVEDVSQAAVVEDQAEAVVVEDVIEAEH